MRTSNKLAPTLVPDPESTSGSTAELEPADSPVPEVCQGAGSS